MHNKKFKIAVLQNKQGITKQITLGNIEKDLLEAIKNEAKMIFLGEFCNMIPYTGSAQDFAEDFDEIDPLKAPTVHLFKRIAKEHSVYIVGGLLEKNKQSDKPFNSAIVVGKKGQIITVCRKLHLFNAYFKEINYRASESNVFTPGFEITTFDTEWCKIGLAICYDIRFPELAQIMRQKGCKVLLYPAAFGLKTGTGKLHWDLLCRTRALDSQCYVIAPEPARYTENPNVYQTWGNSKIVNPLGIVLAGAQPNEDLHQNKIFYAEIDLDQLDYVREQQFCYQDQRRLDVYTLPTAKL